MTDSPHQAAKTSPSHPKDGHVPIEPKEESPSLSPPQNDADVDVDGDLESAPSEISALLMGQRIDVLRTPHTDVRGLSMLRYGQFWLQALIMASLSGVGLMTIK